MLYTHYISLDRHKSLTQTLLPEQSQKQKSILQMNKKLADLSEFASQHAKRFKLSLCYLVLLFFYQYYKTLSSNYSYFAIYLTKNHLIYLSKIEKNNNHRFLQMFIQLMFQISFQDYSPAVFIRNLTQETIQPYANAWKYYGQEELGTLLVKVFGWMEFQVSQELMRVLEYGKEKYVRIAFDELTDYILEMHLGINTIIRYNKYRGYARRDQKIMNKKEFLETLTMGLDYLKGSNISQFMRQFQVIFEQIDRRKVGTIPQSEYNNFLKYYFGSESPMVVNPTKRITQISESQQLITPNPKQQSSEMPYEQKEEVINQQVTQQKDQYYLSNKKITAQSLSNRSLKARTALDEFHDLIVSSITELCQRLDMGHNGYLDRSQCYKFLYDSLELLEDSIEFILSSYFDFNKCDTISYSEFVQIVCEVHFREIFTKIIKNQKQIQSPLHVFMDKAYFTFKLQQNCRFFPKQPTKQLLQRVFDQLSFKSGNIVSNQICLQEFRSFILVRCCNNKFIFRHQVKKSTHTLTNPPASIMEAQNSHFEEDQSQNSSYRPSRKQFSSAHKSIERGYMDSKQQSVEGEIGLSNNKRNKTNKLSQESISMQFESLPASFPISNKEVNTSMVKEKGGSSHSIHLKIEDEKCRSKKHIQTQKQYEKRPFKEVLWNSIETAIAKYALSEYGRLSKQQCDSLFNNEAIFDEDRSTFKTKISKIYTKQTYASTELIANYIIHLKGEEALTQFSKLQIKGKSTLNQMQIAQILYNAYGQLMHLTKQSLLQFSKLLFLQNGKSLFQYKNYLELIARNLSIKNNF